MSPELTPKQRRFVEEYLIDLNATQAAIRAGYSEKTAYSQGGRLLKNVEIQAAIQAAYQRRSERTELTQDWVLERLEENIDRSLRAVPAIDREGNPTGEYTYQGNVANRALELVGKHLGMFKERVEHSGPEGGPIQHEVSAKDELTARILGIASRTGADGDTGEPV